MQSELAHIIFQVHRKLGGPTKISASYLKWITLHCTGFVKNTKEFPDNTKTGRKAQECYFLTCFISPVYKTKLWKPCLRCVVIPTIHSNFFQNVFFFLSSIINSRHVLRNYFSQPWTNLLKVYSTIEPSNMNHAVCKNIMMEFRYVLRKVRWQNRQKYTQTSCGWSCAKLISKLSLFFLFLLEIDLSLSYFIFTINLNDWQVISPLKHKLHLRCF